MGAVVWAVWGQHFPEVQSGGRGTPIPEVTYRCCNISLDCLDMWTARASPHSLDCMRIKTR